MASKTVIRPILIGWFPYDRGSQIAIRSAIVCDHMETTSAIVCDPAIAIAEDRTMFYLKAGFHRFPYDRRRSQTCDPQSYGNQPLERIDKGIMGRIVHAALDVDFSRAKHLFTKTKPIITKHKTFVKER